MPYSLPSDIGGDSPENVKWMEKCVTSIQKTGKEKSSAIAICKAQLIKRKRNAKSDEDVVIDDDVTSKYRLFELQYINKKMNEGMTFAQASADLSVYLARKNWEIG